ncbi:2OG-Fe(II) oxygenase [Parvularcula sp. LCG005]|uniref:2OG-Fe(II) oxygenase n=1 Tax=Parvularcula sp. LCG005 TaxID=3078805 RepID=UPI002943466E|nr:2OG-Fe(II) oxygenase [Parvularcula sp. LCG005]WOI53661.1 2OG-Fe(II) oxygenase [Parvularcula sp. LCG005]
MNVVNGAGPDQPFFDGETGLSANLAASLTASLASDGWARATGALSPALVTALRDEAIRLDAASVTKDAGVGRGADYQQDRNIRRTRITWLDGSSPVQIAFLRYCETLRQAMNRELFAGLQSFEAHYAIYPPGGHYTRHLDAFAHPSRPAGERPIRGHTPKNRVMSLVCYLNEAWDEADGGTLALWDHVPVDPTSGQTMLAALDRIPPTAVIQPRGGDILLMRSEAIPHEVRETIRTRYGIAGWWRIAPSAADLVF